ncbi:lysine N(6)-hydroxylase/L-ornithine N(5)-oxygenase family protein [Amaricoccus solimangrovi]|uniref:lysine N(6)-hydroxylase/L-ornithine N(5)-oxygenase family protein n=1 Tax=Amaricoccus solimangrovi TaxID=2589815 RepID=UPI0015E3221F|nr:lysine N(6)-hydroxylase/L-ornithine N(5)-oxygenase family protein [Amaricoccus solimangrovi]
MSDTFDLVGVGFGPSNLSLAVALRERGSRLVARFLEARPAFAWHPDMMIAGSDMQVSFLKDLVSLRNPRSAFSFLSYLHAKGRLTRFINRKTFFPSREEFNDYLGWVAGQLDVCSYDRRVTAIEPVRSGGEISALRVSAESASGAREHFLARNLVLAPGGRPYWPEPFAALRGSARVLHARDYLGGVAARLRPGTRIAVIGGGQSGAEIFADLAGRPEAPRVEMILRAGAPRPSDDSPFVNEIFHPEETGRFHALPPEARERRLAEAQPTNYSVVDHDLIATMYDLLYEQSVRGEDRLALRARTSVLAAAEDADGIRLRLVGAEGETRAGYDLVILATGYRRGIDRALLGGIGDWWTGAPPARDYRLPMAAGFGPAVFVQGQSEPTHGVGDTLLSVLALRSDEIAEAIEAQGHRGFALAAE